MMAASGSYIDPEYEYNAPQFVDFCSDDWKDDSDIAEEYFRVNATPLDTLPDLLHHVDDKENHPPVIAAGAAASGQDFEQQEPRGFKPTNRSRSSSVGCTPSRIPRAQSSHNFGKSSVCSTNYFGLNREGRSVGILQERPPSYEREDLEQDLQRSKTYNVLPKSKLTVPHTPKFMRHTTKYQYVSSENSTEDRELEQIRDFRKAMAERRRVMEEYRLKALNSKGYKPVQSSQPLTQPAAFSFATDERIKTHGMETRQDKQGGSKTNDTAMKDKNADRPRVTIAKPFSFNEKQSTKAQKTADTDGNFVSIAEQVNKFSQKTPSRYRRRLRDSSPDQRRRSMSQPNLKLTVPKTPSLQTKGRSRPTHVKSHLEQEAEKEEQFKRGKFQAHPVNRKALENPFIPQRSSREPIKPEPFKLHSNSYGQLKKREVDGAEENKTVFRAQQVPKKLFEGPVGIKPAKQLPLTVPESPAFALRDRLRNTMKVPKELQSTDPPVYSHPVPQAGVGFAPKLEHKTTVPQPFSFYEKDMERLKKKEDKLKEMLAEAAKLQEFHANPVPDFTTPDNRPRQTKPLTQPVPFDFAVEQRGKHRAEQWEAKVKEDLQKVKDSTSFKAKPCNLGKEAFLISKSDRPPTKPANFELATHKRLEKRRAYEEWKADKERELAEIQRQQEERQVQEEQEKLEHQRQETVHKAHPVRRFKSLCIQPSDQRLTTPASPKFSKRLARYEH